MYDDEDDLFYDYYSYDSYDRCCQCSECRAYREYNRGYWAGYYDALDSLEGLP
jgi:hypothetical protein